MLAVAVYDDLEHNAALQETWRRLLEGTPDPAFAQTPECLVASGRGNYETPLVFVAAVAGKVVGLWPMTSRQALGPLGRVRTLNALTPIGPNPTATAAVVARHLAANPGRWEELRATESAAQGGVGRLATAFASAGLTPAVSDAAPLADVVLEGRWTDVLARCDDPTRFALYRSVHNAGRDDGFALDRIRPTRAAGFDGLLHDVTTTAARGRTWGDAAGLADLMTAAAVGEAADVAVLRHAGRPVAAAAGFVTTAGAECRVLAVAVDAPSSAPARLVAELLRDGMARGDRRFTFVAASGHPMAGWATSLTPRRRIVVAAPGRPIASLNRMGAAMGRFVMPRCKTQAAF